MSCAERCTHSSPSLTSFPPKNKDTYHFKQFSSMGVPPWAHRMTAPNIYLFEIASLLSGPTAAKSMAWSDVINICGWLWIFINIDSLCVYLQPILTWKWTKWSANTRHIWTWRSEEIVCQLIHDISGEHAERDHENCAPIQLGIWSDR